MFGGEVEEREEDVAVLVEGRDRLRVLGAILGGEPLDRLAGLLTGLSVHHLVERGLHTGLEALRELVENVAELVELMPISA